MAPCLLCGDTKPLTPEGICSWRAGCEHRQLQVRSADERFDADLAQWFVPQDCGHTGTEHVEMWRELAATEPVQVPSWIQWYLDGHEPG